jgi:hypothetical protein
LRETIHFLAILRAELFANPRRFFKLLDESFRNNIGSSLNGDVAIFFTTSGFSFRLVK